MYRILLLSSSAVLISACSMNNEARTYGHSQTASSGCYVSQCASGCYVSQCPTGATYSVANQQSSTQYDYNQGYQQQPQAQSYSYDYAQQPDPHVYGTQVQGGHYTPAAYAQGGQYTYGAPQLRGPHKARRNGYIYGSLGTSLYDVDSDAIGLQARLGYQSAYYVGAELEGSVGVIKESASAANVDYQIAGFAVGRLPITDRIAVHARGGYHSTQIGIGGGSVTLDGVAYGGGAEYAWNPRNSVRVDYTRYEEDSTSSALDSVSLAFAHKF
ncbi:MAG: outer membrane protein [Alphaproteobacteria bacterium]